MRRILYTMPSKVLHLPNISSLLQIQRIPGFSWFGCKANKNKFPNEVVLDGSWTWSGVFSLFYTSSSASKTQPHSISTKRMKTLINLISIYRCGSTDSPHDSFWFWLSCVHWNIRKFNFGSHLAISWLKIIYYRYFYCKTIPKSIFIYQALFGKNNVSFCAVFCCVWECFLAFVVAFCVSCYVCIHTLWQQSYVNQMLFHIANAGIQFECNPSIAEDLNSWNEM